MTPRMTIYKTLRLHAADLRYRADAPHRSEVAREELLHKAALAERFAARCEAEEKSPHDCSKPSSD